MLHPKGLLNWNLFTWFAGREKGKVISSTPWRY